MKSTHYSLLITHYSLFITNYSLFTIHHSPFTIHHSPFTYSPIHSPPDRVRFPHHLRAIPFEALRYDNAQGNERDNDESGVGRYTYAAHIAALLAARRPGLIG